MASLRHALLVSTLLEIGCGTKPAHSAVRPPTCTPPEASTGLTVRSVALPGAPADRNVMMDYIAYVRIEGFPTQEMERHGHERIVGPSSASIGDGVVYVGNRGDFSVCAIDATSLKRGARNAVASDESTAYVTDAAEGRILIAAPAK